MSVSDEFVTYIIDQLSGWGAVTPRRMFGGAGLYHDGRMFGLIADDVVYLKVDDRNRADFERAGCTPFRPFSARPTTMSYFTVPAGVLEDPQALGRWAQRAFEAGGR